MVRVLPTTGDWPIEVPQSAHREDDGKYPEHTEREERPKEEEALRGLTTLTIPVPLKWITGMPVANDPSDEGDDVPRSPFGEHQRAYSQTTRMLWQ